MTRPGSLVLVRHGESTHNAAHVFSGRLDVDLTATGTRQAGAAAGLLRDAGVVPDRIVASPMRRARDTADIIREGLALDVELEESWRLVERDYGFLTGMPKHEARTLLGAEEFITLRRTLHGLPGPVDPDRATGWDWYDDPSVEGLPDPGRGESLAHVIDRVAPCWAELVGLCGAGADVMVVAHGNSLRALCALVDGLDEREVLELNLPPGQPLVYAVEPDGTAHPRGGRFLDERTAEALVEVIAHEGGT